MQVAVIAGAAVALAQVPSRWAAVMSHAHLMVPGPKMIMASCSSNDGPEPHYDRHCTSTENKNGPWPKVSTL